MNTATIRYVRCCSHTRPVFYGLVRSHGAKQAGGRPGGGRLQLGTYGFSQSILAQNVQFGRA